MCARVNKVRIRMGVTFEKVAGSACEPACGRRKQIPAGDFRGQVRQLLTEGNHITIRYLEHFA